MLNILTDNLSRLEGLTSLIPSMIQLIVIIILILLIRFLHFKYQSFLVLSLILLFLAAILTSLSLSEIAGGVGEYSFMFLTVGIIQMVFSRD